MAGGAFERRAAATGDCHTKHAGTTGCGAAGLDRNARQTHGRDLVWSADGDGIAGGARPDGSDFVDYGDFRNGRLLGKQAAQGTGNSHSTGRPTEGNPGSGAG